MIAMSVRDYAKRCLFQLLRVSFRLTPMPIAMRDRLRQRFIDHHASLLPRRPRGQMIENNAGGNTGLHRPLQHVANRAVGYVPYRAGSVQTPLPVTLVAFYLPQFHPIPENDIWWGPGFTEWRNVTRALPQFEGHAQPRLPSELGFYDLRLPQAMHQQMQLAHEYGIGAFCSYFYWFAGKTLLEAPLQQWLNDSTLSLPLCLCWANENWSRRWDGRADDILIGQQHSPADDLAFIAYVSRYLRDPRYLRVNGKPLLLIYRPGLLPDPKGTAARWREWCLANNIGEIHLAYVQSFDRVDPRTIGFDAAVEFPPNNTTLTPITARQHLINPVFQGDVYDWRDLAHQATTKSDPPYPLFPGINPGWDNEPRRSGAGRVFLHASPRGYRDWLRHAIDVALRRVPASPLVFINAWNEWAEGAVLEPDTRLGHAWLEATRNALRDTTEATPLHDQRPCAVVHIWYLDVLDEIIDALRATQLDWRIVITTAHEQEQAIRERIATLGVEAEIAAFENRGRDILPFLHVANRLLDEGVEVVLKLHSKRTTHRQDGAAWRQELLEKLLSAGRAQHILSALRTDPSLGLIAAEGHLQPLQCYWGANEANVAYLCRRIGITSPVTETDQFIAGSMFWIRLAALRPLLDTHLGVWEFEDETGQIDGTLAHAVERVIGLASTNAGFSTKDAATVCGLSINEVTRPYPYARRSS
ncbi:glycoside hydrolase family 99-like domain-containing protein [Dyella silvatica]|uniref:glycoside hydrolase family 99-like domain-containing protein n=1 Tax=Dyella silvatica TaxID=2992128 RepID=UPI00225AFC20|nr:glycoside hydrolase family 99-like domain-containing protein [Dyella silvatica]